MIPGRVEETDSALLCLQYAIDQKIINQPVTMKQAGTVDCGVVFEQLARYTMRYSDLHLGLYSSLTFANNLNLPTLVTLLYFSTLLYLLVQV